MNMVRKSLVVVITAGLCLSQAKPAGAGDWSRDEQIKQAEAHDLVFRRCLGKGLPINQSRSLLARIKKAFNKNKEYAQYSPLSESRDALHAACESGDLTLIKFLAPLYKENGYINRRYDGAQGAVYGGISYLAAILYNKTMKKVDRRRAIKVLLEQGCEPERYRNIVVVEVNCFGIAAKMNDIQCLKLLIDHAKANGTLEDALCLSDGVDEERYETAMYRAIACGSLEAAKLLWSQGFEIDIPRKFAKRGVSDEKKEAMVCFLEELIESGELEDADGGYTLIKEWRKANSKEDA